MIKLKYVSMIAGLGLLALSSCNDYLDKVPDTRVYLENVDQLQKLLVDGYMGNDYAAVCELSSDNIVDNTAPDKNGNRYNLAPDELADNQLFAWEDVTLGTGSDTPYSIWNSCYASIAVANAVLEKAEEFEANNADKNGELSYDEQLRLKAIKGEAYMIRAYHHFILANVFCMPYAGPERGKKQVGLPYMKETETKVSPQYERGNLADFYAAIEKDLLAGLELVTDQYYEVPRYHFNVNASNAFAAQYYLWVRDYKKAEYYATLALGENPAANMNNLWRRDNLYTGEDHVRANSGITNPSIYMSIATYSTWSRRPGGRYGCKDNAASGTFRGPGPTWNSSHPCFQGMIFYRGSQEYGLMFFANWGELFEYTDKLAGIGYVHMMRNEFTVEKTLLIRAEAEIFLGKTAAAIADLKMWLDNRDNCVNKSNVIQPLTAGNIERFYNKDPKTNFEINKPMHIDEVFPSSEYSVTPEMVPYLQCVQHFRRIETAHKGDRFFDLKRYGIEVTHRIGASRVETLKVGDKRWAIQLPYEVWIAGMEKNDRDAVTPTEPTDTQSMHLAE